MDPVKHGHLLQIIHQQEERISELEQQEEKYITDLQERTKLIQELQQQVNESEKMIQERAVNVDDIREYIVDNYSLLQQEVNKTDHNIKDIDQYVDNILKMVKKTIDIINKEEEKNNKMMIQNDIVVSRMIHIDQIKIDNMIKKKVSSKSITFSDDISFDPYIVLRLTDDDVIETKRIYKSGPNPCWNELNIDIQAVNNQYNDDYNKLIIEVWDDYSMKLSNELLCSGMISFTHLDLLCDRGPMMTSCDLFDTKNNRISTAYINIKVESIMKSNVNNKGDDENVHSQHVMMKSEYDVDEKVLCNYGGEGEWLEGKIIRYKKLRDRLETRRLYEVEFTNGDLEINVPVGRLKELNVLVDQQVNSTKKITSSEGVDGSEEVMLLSS